MRLRPRRPRTGHRQGADRAPGAARAAGRPLQPAGRHPSGRPHHVGGLPVRLGGIYHRRLVDRGLLHFTHGLRTAEDRPWIWRLHREAESFAAVGLLGVFYRRGVASSLTQIGDVRQLDFIRAFDQVIEETARDPEADKLLPKAVRTYAAVMAHHLDSVERFEPAVARKLRSMSAAALQRLPQDLLSDTLDSLGDQRAARLRRVRRRPVPAGTVPSVTTGAST